MKTNAVETHHLLENTCMEKPGGYQISRSIEEGEFFGFIRAERPRQKVRQSRLIMD